MRGICAGDRIFRSAGERSHLPGPQGGVVLICGEPLHRRHHSVAAVGGRCERRRDDDDAGVGGVCHARDVRVRARVAAGEELQCGLAAKRERHPQSVAGNDVDWNLVVRALGGAAGEAAPTGGGRAGDLGQRTGTSDGGTWRWTARGLRAARLWSEANAAVPLLDRRLLRSRLEEGLLEKLAARP